MNYNGSGIQRGSLLTADWTGDPLTPYEAALPLDRKDTPDRLDPEEAGLHSIPVTPISYGAANHIFKHMSGEVVPKGWQGGLPYTYRLQGGADLKVRLKVEQPKTFTDIYNIVGTLKGKCVGVLGAGSIGTALVDLARCFEFQIIGLTRSGHSTGEFDAVYAAADKLAMASQCDFLVSLLPDTPATRHFIDAALLSALPAHCVLINAGRGGNIDDSALLAALDRGTIKAAVLDVFDEEPLPADHPYWQHPRVWITQHTAALSNPADVVNVFADNYRRWISGEPLDYLIDFDEGY